MKASDIPMTGAQAVAHVIASQPNPVVYGMPGGYAMYIFDALGSVRDKVKTYLVRQESIATVMAEAHGRLTNSPAFVVAQGAWVLGNASIGVMEAHLGASPMVLLIDATDGGSFSHLGPYQGGLGGYGSYDLVAALKAISKRVFVATDATQALQMTQLAVKHATTGEPGPVAVVFNAHSLKARFDSEAEPPAHPSRDYKVSAVAVAPQQAIDSAAEAIRASRRPVIVAGNGVRLAQAEKALLAFSRRHAIPVATTPAGKGVFPENDDLAVGVMGSFGHEAANRAVGQADLVLALGTKLGANDTAHVSSLLIDPVRQTLVQVDIEPLNLSWTFPIDIAVPGDLAQTLPKLSDGLSKFSAEGHEVATWARQGTGYFDRLPRSKPGELSARDVVSAMSKRLPHDTIVTCDAGENRLFVLRDFQSKHGGTVLQPNGGGGMGYALPAAMSAALLFPDRRAVAVCGDGGISMSMHGLMSAVELGVRMTVVVLDNGVLGWVHSGQGGRQFASILRRFDYSAIASAMECSAVSVDSLKDFEEAIEASLARDGVSFIVARTTTQDRYQDVQAKLGTNDLYAIEQSADGSGMSGS